MHRGATGAIRACGCKNAELMSLTFYTFASPPRFYALTGILVPIFWVAAIALTMAGLWIGFFVAPTDATQGNVARSFSRPK